MLPLIFQFSLIEDGREKWRGDRDFHSAQKLAWKNKFLSKLFLIKISCLKIIRVGENVENIFDLPKHAKLKVHRFHCLL